MHRVSEDPLRQEIAYAIRSSVTRPARSFANWLEQEVVLPDGPFAGRRFRFDRQPVSRLWADAIDSGLWSEFICTAPSQWGKSLIAFVSPALYHLCELKENYVLGVPYADMAANKWEVDIQPVMNASPALRRLLPTSGSGSQGGKIKDSVTLKNGSVLKVMSAGGDDTNKAAFSSRVLGLTEAARFSGISDASVEADPYRQLQARLRSNKVVNRRTYCEGTVTIEEELPQRLHALSTQSRIVSKCPHCPAWIEPGRECLSGWEEARSDKEALESAWWCCPECGQMITEEERRLCLVQAVLLHRGQTIDAAGKISGDPPSTLRLWFRASAWHNMLLGPGDSAVDEWKATQIPDDSPELISAERELHQFVWCLPYKPPRFDTDLELDRDSIANRRLDIPQRVLPEDTEIVTVGVDMGGRTGWQLVLAERSDGTRHIADYGPFDIPSDQMTIEEAFVHSLRELAESFEPGWTVANTNSVRMMDQCWYDAGYITDAVLQHVHDWAGMQRKSPHIASYGRGSTFMDKANYAAPKKTGNEVREIDPRGLYYTIKVRRAKTHAVYWDGDLTKWQVQQALTLPRGTPGSITLFAGTRKIHERLVRHFTNEKLITETHPLRGEIQKWKRTGDNHLLDCLAAAWRAADRVRNLGIARPAMIPTGKQAEKPKPPSGDESGDWYGGGKAKAPAGDDWYG